MQVFVNRILNMRRIKYLGLDMDHTLIRYHTRAFETLVYQYVIQELILHSGYPKALEQLVFQFNDVIRGLVVDSRNGNILKLSRYGAIRQSFHGTKPIDYAKQKHFYGGAYVDLNDHNYMVIDTSFSIAFCALYGQLVDLKDQDPEGMPTYNVIATDVLHAVDKVHADGRLKHYLSEHMDEYVIRDPSVVEGLKRFIEHGKKIFILTNSDYRYTRLLLDYAINPFLDSNETWQDLFEFVITFSDKPRFFFDKLRFLRVDPETGAMTNHVGPITKGIYQGGNAFKFSEDLHLSGDDILYVGDHIYGDILRLKKICNWRTALVVEELGTEISGQKQSYPIEQKIVQAMQVKRQLEQQYIAAHSLPSAAQETTLSAVTQELQDKIMQVDQEIARLLQQQHAHFNLHWDRVFRTGAEESYFANQVQRYACIYMERLSDLLNSSPLTYFRPERRILPHDLAV